MAKLFVLLVAIVLVFWQTTANHEPGHVGNDDNGFLRRNNEGGLLGRNRNRDSTFDNNRNSDVNNDRVGRTGSNGDFNGNTNGGQGGDDQNGDMGSTDSGFTGPDPFATSTSGGIQEGNSTTPSGQANDQTLPGNFSSTPGRSHTVSQGPEPPTVSALNCGDYPCNFNIQPNGGGGGGGTGNEENPMVIRSRIANPNDCRDKAPAAPRTCQYRNNVGTNMCFGVYCLTVEPGNQYCICPPDSIDYQCATKKPGSCDSATGILPGTAYSVSNRRYRHKTNPDTGSVYARHFATSGTDCIRLCQWTSGQCQSVNYGPINGIQVCELLSVVVTNGSIMQPWLVDAPGWTYTTVTGRAAAV